MLKIDDHKISLLTKTYVEINLGTFESVNVSGALISLAAQLGWLINNGRSI